MDGNWSVWIFFSFCLNICGDGIIFCYRICLNLVLLYGGKFCLGIKMEIMICSDGLCLGLFFFLI